MFNIFKRDKQVENKDPQPITDQDLTATDQEETTAPLNPIETPEAAPLAQSGGASSSPTALEPGSHPEQAADAEAPQPVVKEEPAETSAPSSPPIKNETAARATVPDLASLKKPNSSRKSVLYHLFSPETRLGRFMRPVLRWLAAITGLFALGLLAGYLLLYQPTQSALDAALEKLTTASQLVSQKEQGLASAQTGLNQAQLSVKQIQDQLAAAASENSLLIVMVDVSNARVALVEKDGAAAKTAIAQAQANLNLALPYIESQDKVLSDLLQTRLDLISKELVSDAQGAQTDLGKLSSDLTDLHKKIFGQ